ncbi:MAG: hypothetical protein RSA73_04140 [Anaerovoracaceae bacterium]
MMNINKLIGQVFQTLELNNFHTLGKPDEPIWETPLIGVAAGDDHYYAFLKEHIGPFHWSPKEAFNLKYNRFVQSRDLRVVSMVFPQTEATKMAQKQAKVFPCDRWTVSRGEWEPLIREFSKKMVIDLEAKGIPCVSIDLQPEFKREISTKEGIASVWSHRHTAYAAGLGTFGLSDGLITEKGKAIRLTSLIVEADLDVTPKTYSGHHDWCLYYRDGSCKACINRCPVNAISLKGHDKDVCSNYEDLAVENYWPTHIKRGDYIFGCGLCQAGVPCQDKRP